MNQLVELPTEFYGELLPYIMDDDVSDIDCNGECIWITHSTKGRYRLNERLDPFFIASFCQKLATSQRKNFNMVNPLLEAETNHLRISVLHEEVSVGGRSISIRKSLPKQRIRVNEAVENGYATMETLEFLLNCVKEKFTFVICGGPGSGKTECAKFLAGSIPAEDRIITIEDNLEWHLKMIHPEADIVELKVRCDGEGFGYREAIKASLRQNPKWLMLSEARGEEAKQLMEAWSTGISGITTMHTDDTAKIPERIMNMIGGGFEAKRLENQIYSDIDIGILLAYFRDDTGKIQRRIDQIRIFHREDGENIGFYYVKNGAKATEQMPEGICRKLKSVLASNG